MERNLKAFIGVALIAIGIMGVFVPAVASEYSTATEVRGTGNLVDYVLDPVPDTTDSTPGTGGGGSNPKDTLPPPEPPWT